MLARPLFIVGVIVFGLAAGCSRGNLASNVAGDAPSDPMLSAQRCGGEGTTPRPLVLEWPAADRASLEVRLRKGLVAVHFDACRVEVLRNCTVPGAYTYEGATRKTDHVRIRNEDELRANLPLSAVKLAGKLQRAGELSVAMALVGVFEADNAIASSEALTGACTGATHVISAVQVGAFELHTGSSAEISAGIDVTHPAASGVGVGGHSVAEREVLSRDGDPVACEASSTGDAAPPEGCGALLRLELTALDTRQREACPEGTVWQGERCEAPTVHCPEGSVPTEDGCVAASAAQHTASAGTGLCNRVCERQLHCQSEQQGMPLPEGKTYARILGRCVRQCSAMMDNDYGRPAMRKCLAMDGCTEFSTCMQGPDDDFDKPLYAAPTCCRAATAPGRDPADDLENFAPNPGCVAL